MRIISLIQPWATLLVAGAKKIETRGWSTSYRGPVAVHATKVVDAKACRRPAFAEALAWLGFNEPEDLPLGAILGRVDLVDVLTMIDCDRHLRQAGEMCLRCDKRLTTTEREFGFYAAGRVAWVTGPERLVLADPIPHRGGQGLRNLSPAIAARLA